MGWSYNFWKNNFYSKKAKPENFLEEYSQHFNTVEVNSSFYKVPSISDLKKWKKQTTDKFIFSIKAPKKITHQQNLEYLEYFLENISTLKPKLGPILLQFPPSYKLENFTELKNLISVLPKKQKHAIELRNNSWFIPETYNLLTENKIALVMTDKVWLEEKEKITTDFVYFRWQGNRKQIKGTKGIEEKNKTIQIQKYAKKIKTYPNNMEIFGYFSKYFSGHPPTDAKKILKLLQNKNNVNS
jgi:uncharacterized protein YecE (DUF72 family)